MFFFFLSFFLLLLQCMDGWMGNDERERKRGGGMLVHSTPVTYVVILYMCSMIG